MFVKQYIQFYLFPVSEGLTMHHKIQACIISKTQTHKNLKKSAAPLNTAATVKTLTLLPASQTTKD